MKSLSVSEFCHLWSQENNAGSFGETDIFPSINKFIPHLSQLVLVTYRQRMPDSVLESF